MCDNEEFSVLLHLKDCPFGYRCLANDCIQCAELQPKSEIDFDYEAEDER